MKSLGEIGGLFKRHYEKALLALALVGLIGAVVYLIKVKRAESERLEGYERGIPRRGEKPIPAADMSALSGAIQRSTNSSAIILAPCRSPRYLRKSSCRKRCAAIPS